MTVVITTLGTGDSGATSRTTINTNFSNLNINASSSATGLIQLATSAEINTGTDTGKAMPTDQFVASNRNLRYITIRVYDSSTNNAAVTTIGGDFECPITGTITDVGAWVDTAGTTGLQTINIKKNGTTILSTNITLDSTEKSSRTAATPAVISVTSLVAGDIITIDNVGVQTTPAKGLTVRLTVKLT